MRPLMLAITYLLLTTHAYTGWQMSMSTSKASYEYGERIEVALRFSNAGITPDTLFSTTTCVAWIRPDDVVFGMTCGYMEVYLAFNPGESRTWFWHLDPMAFAYPTYTGRHTVWGICGGIIDSVQFDAPAFRGGTLFIQFNSGTPQRVVDSIRTSINATLVTHYRDTVEIAELWTEVGFLADSLVLAFTNDPRVKHVQVSRSLQPDSLFVDAVDVQSKTPTSFALNQNYPNPFNPTTTITYTLPTRIHVSLSVFNVLGEEVAQLVNGNQPEGEHLAEFNAGHLPSGVYFLRLTAGTYQETKRMILLR